MSASTEEALRAPVVLVEDREAVRIVRMNRPAKLNALNQELSRSLRDELVAADAAESVRAVVLAGAGRGFCAGADVTEFEHLTPGQSDAVLARADLTTELQLLPGRIGKPIVSAVHGPALGGGAGLALACDMCVAATDLRFGYPEMRHSIVPAIVMTGLQRHVGRKLAFELITTGRTLDAEEAERHGLVNRVVEPDELIEAALEVARRWTEANPVAMRSAKQLFHRVAELPLAEAMQAGRDANVIMRGFRG